MSLKYVLLGLLTEQPKHGYELKLEAEQLLGGSAELNPGQLYPLLRKLADQQLIAGERIEQEDRPDKRVFTLTEAGAQDLSRWLAEPVPPNREPPSPFLPFALLPPVPPPTSPPSSQEQRPLPPQF